MPLPHFATALFDARYIPEFAARSLHWLPPRHATIHQVGELLITMLTYRCEKLVVVTAVGKRLVVA